MRTAAGGQRRFRANHRVTQDDMGAKRMGRRYEQYMPRGQHDLTVEVVGPLPLGDTGLAGGRPQTAAKRQGIVGQQVRQGVDVHLIASTTRPVRY